MLTGTPGAVVGANFSTMLPVGGGEESAHAALAILNSARGRASLKLMAAVMGGGALKAGAAHLSAMPARLPSPIAGKPWRVWS